jgi:hypothetical protein
LKIDTSQISLSTKGKYLEELHTREETRLTFSRLYDDQKQTTTSETLSVQEEDKTRQHEWAETRTIDNTQTDNTQIDAHPTKYGKSLFSAYEFYSSKINQLRNQNGTLHEEDAVKARNQREETKNQYLEYAPSLNFIDLTGNPELDDIIYLFQPLNPLSDAQQDHKSAIQKRINTQAARTRENAVRVSQAIRGDAPVFEGPDSLSQDIEKMKRLIEKIGEKLSALSNDAMWKSPAEDPDYEKKHASDFKNTKLEWANINSSAPEHLARGGYTYEYDETSSFTRHEKKEINFLANGLVNTTDGRQINFSLELNLEKEIFEESLFIKSEEGYVFIDPLVINLDGTAPQLSEAKFTFDLDADGVTEDILMLTQGSGFLCLDKNEDGIINDGRELFGPGTGNGFLELLKYDQDQNLWIDENDDVFDELAFWENDGTGNMRLTKIKDAGIGAIYLANSNTSMDVLDKDNNVQARIKKSGVALNEDGSVASVMEMDWLA